MDINKFHEANWINGVIILLKEKKQFWHNVKDQSNKEVCSHFILPQELMFKIDSIVDEINGCLDVEIARRNKMIEDL